MSVSIRRSNAAAARFSAVLRPALGLVIGPAGDGRASPGGRERPGRSGGSMLEVCWKRTF